MTIVENANSKDLTVGFLWSVIFIAELLSLIMDGAIFHNLFRQADFTLPSDLQCFWTNGALAVHDDALMVRVAAKISPFMYPPPFLILAAPLSWLHPLAAYIVWTSLTAINLILATPYAYVYDLPALAVAVTGYALQENPPALLPLCLFFAVTGSYIWVAALGWPLTGAGLLLLLLFYVWFRRDSPIATRQAAPARVMP